jgi:hypothetical protein
MVQEDPRACTRLKQKAEGEKGQGEERGRRRRRNVASRKYFLGESLNLSFEDGKIHRDTCFI